MDLEQYETVYPPRQLPSGAEVTRVAPSPTGRPHIGTALQALIDRALADQSGGLFLLRIEDTDRKRLDPRAIEEILEALEWLGLSPDEGPHVGGDYGPYLQSERLPLYQAAARWLVERGYAYHCFCSAERLEALRQAQQAAGQTSVYDRHCRGLSPAEVARRLAAGEPSVIRLKVPDGERIVFHDPLRGEIAFDSAQVDDQVLLKSDGFPTYHLAVVVDDHFMRVTTAVRGEEWISSTPKHLLLYRYFGWTPPRIVHTVLLRDASHRKLSKRSGDTSIAWYRLQGYLSQGFRNFLSRIIWAHPEDRDVYSYDEFVRLFRVEDLSKAGPVADHDLLDFINSQYMRQLSPSELYRATCTWLDEVLREEDAVAFEEARKSGRELRTYTREEIARFAAAFRQDPEFTCRVLTVEPERFKKLSDIPMQYSFFFPALFQPPTVDMLAKPAGGIGQAMSLLRAYLDVYDPADGHEAWEAKVRAMADAAGVKAKGLFMAIRVATTGSEQTPPLYDILNVLGGEEVRRRLRLALEALAAAQTPATSA